MGQKGHPDTSAQSGFITNSSISTTELSSGSDESMLTHYEFIIKMTPLGAPRGSKMTLFLYRGPLARGPFWDPILRVNPTTEWKWPKKGSKIGPLGRGPGRAPRGSKMTHFGPFWAILFGLKAGGPLQPMGRGPGRGQNDPILGSILGPLFWASFHLPIGCP